MKKIKLKKLLGDYLKSLYKLGYGLPKHKIKGFNNSSPYIHSKATLDTYLKAIKRFCDYCYSKDITSDYAEAKNAVKGYLEYLESIGTSAWTIRTHASACAKAFTCNTKDFNYTFPKRERNSIKRSRFNAERDKHVSKRSNELVIAFCKATGVRRSELETMRGTFEHKGVKMDRVVFRNGIYYLRIKGKGGKVREAEIYGSETEVRKIVDFITSKGEQKLFQHVHSMLDIHSFRAEYAASIYRKYARPLDTLDKSEIYCCKKEFKGLKFDKKAMLIASQSLGHNRISVIANNYSWTI